MEHTDEIDEQILHYLTIDSQITLKELEDKIDKKISTIHNRIKKLEENGIIKNYTVNIDMSKINYPLISFIMLSFDNTVTELDQVTVAEQIADIPRVEEVHLIAGEFDILVKVRSKNIDDLGVFVTKDIKEVPGIGGSRTFVSLKSVKEDQEPYLISDVANKLNE